MATIPTPAFVAMPHQNIDVVRPKPPKTSFHRSPHSFFIMGVNFRLEIDLVPLSLEGLSNHLLIPASHVTVRRIVEIDSQIEGAKDDGGVPAVHYPHAHSSHLDTC